MIFTANNKDISLLEKAYAGRTAYHGEMHDHSASGGTSDGEVPLKQYKQAMIEKEMDFAAILDHRQIRHMFSDDFDRKYFICGTEPGTRILDVTCSENGLHYNMVFPSPDGLIQLLADFDSIFHYSGGTDGTFQYPRYTHNEFREIADHVMELGGFFTIPHPTDFMNSEDPLDYYFGDYTGIEVFYDDYRGEKTAKNYRLWTDLLKLGKREFACAGGDAHSYPRTLALTTIYSDRQYCDAWIPWLRDGDFTCGGIGIRMIAGNTRCGGHCIFDQTRIVCSVGDFHKDTSAAGTDFSIRIYRNENVIHTAPIDLSNQNYFAFDADDEADYYRIEVVNDTLGVIAAIGNPIWNDRKPESAAQQ